MCGCRDDDGSYDYYLFGKLSKKQILGLLLYAGVTKSSRERGIHVWGEGFAPDQSHVITIYTYPTSIFTGYTIRTSPPYSTPLSIHL